MGSREKKSSLEVYRKHRIKRGGVLGIYSNSDGSGLLADARAGMLNTRTLKNKYKIGEEHCRACNKGRENIKHIIWSVKQ